MNSSPWPPHLSLFPRLGYSGLIFTWLMRNRCVRESCLKMATEKDLINAVRDSLETDGKLGRIKAEMRTEVMKLLDGSSKNQKSKRPSPPHDVLVLNELIREYLDWIGYKYTSTVLIAECELPKQPIERAFLTQDLGVKENDKTKSLPLLFSLVETFKNLKTT